MVYCFVDPDRFEANVKNLRAFVHRFGRETSQGEVVVEFDGRSYHIKKFEEQAEPDMAKKIIDSGKTARRIEGTDRAARRIEPEAFAEAIGAEPVEIFSLTGVKSQVPKTEQPRP